MNRIILSTLFVFIIPISLFAYTSPGRPTGFVNDFAKILSTNDISKINGELVTLNQSTGVEMAVATIPSLGDESIETYSVKLFQEWGIGQKGKDNGLLIVIAPNDKSARIEVGYGLEGTVTDLQAGNIVREVMLPDFKNGNYATGIDGAVTALTGIISGDPSIVDTYSQTSSNSSNNQTGSNDSWYAWLFLAIIIINILAKILGSTKSWWLGGVFGAIAGAVIGLIFGFIFIGLGSIVVLTILGLIFDYIVSNHPPKSGGGGFWPIFFGGGGGSGGGFGGFGGGMSGGGGASGRW